MGVSATQAGELTFSVQLISAAESAVPTMGLVVESIRIFIWEHVRLTTHVEVVSAGTAATVGSTSVASKYS